VTSIGDQLIRLGLRLPAPPDPAAEYVPSVISNGFVFLAGQTPKEGTVLRYTGRVGVDLTIEQGSAAARLCVLRSLSALQAAAGSLDVVDQIVMLTVFVNAAAGFKDHSIVADGASNLIGALFGHRGRHARSAVGAGSLPGDAAVEVAMIAQLRFGK
jgi:enamine deaminase RidA (YjgF/YER057c/UK114 family)